MIEYMIQENEDLAEAFTKRFSTNWEEKKEFIIDLINGTKVILIYMQNFVKVHYIIVIIQSEKLPLIFYALFSFSFLCS